jgi:hypothetical protein
LKTRVAKFDDWFESPKGEETRKKFIELAKMI